MNMGHTQAGSKSRAAFNAGESCKRRSVRNQYITLGFAMVKNGLLSGRNRKQPALAGDNILSLKGASSIPDRNHLRRFRAASEGDAETT